MRNAFAFLLFSISICSAQLPTSGESISTSVPGTPVYDVSGRHTWIDSFEVTATVVQHASGSLTGSCEVIYDGDGYSLSGIGPITGKVTGDARAKRAVFKFAGQISGMDWEDNLYSGNYSLNGSATWIPDTASFAGGAKAHYRIPGFGFNSGTRKFGFGMDATCCNMSVTLTNFTASGSSVIGEAKVRNAGRLFDYTVKGRRNAKTGAYTLKLRGTGSGQGSSFTARYSVVEGALQLDSLTGKLLGQSVNVTSR